MFTFPSGNVIELHCNLDEQDEQVIVLKISRLQHQMDQGLLDIDDACTDLSDNLNESLQTALEQRAENLFTVGKWYLPEPLQLRLTSASESEIRFELQASKFDGVPEKLWNDIRICVTSQVTAFLILYFRCP